MSRTKKILVIDTETVGGLKYPIAYDVGFLVTDRHGVIYYEGHFVVKEIFADLQLMATAYYSKKFNTYIESIYEQKIQPLPFGEILRKIDAVIELYDIETISAYNLAFDNRSMSNTCDLLFDNRNWHRDGLTDLCIMCGACDILYNKSYIKMARARGWVTDKGNIKTSAECGYRFVSGDYDFEEEHKGLDDCRIESQILKAIYDKHKPFDGSIKYFPMRQVYAREKALA
jgi:hypothetical protein